MGGASHDASAEPVGAALQQWLHLAAPWRPLGYFLRKLYTVQVKYSAFDREFLALQTHVGGAVVYDFYRS
jgi:hypothetical protein